MTTRGAARRPIGAAALLLVLVILGVGAAGAFVRVSIVDEALRARILRHMEAASGLSVEVAGPITLRLLPRPTLEMTAVSMVGADGAVSLDADGLTGRLGFGDLLTGDLQVHSTVLDRPTVVLDLDRLEPLARLMAGRPAGGGIDRQGARRLPAVLHSDGLTVRSGVVRLLSRDRRRDTIVTDLSATLAWPDETSSASLAGSAGWRNGEGQFAVRLDAPSLLASGQASAASLHVKSTLLDLSADGTLSGSGATVAVGTLSAATPDLAAFLRVTGTPAAQLSAIHRARLSGDATLGDGVLSLAEAHLWLDSTEFEGAMAFNDPGGHPGLVGTLATDRIDLDPFLAALPTLAGSDAGWSRIPFNTRSVAYDDIDLRISASLATVGALAFQDGSLSLQSGNGRMELSLGEARAYDGLLKGRVVATLRDDQTEVHADATLSRLDLTSLARDAGGLNDLKGTTTGHMTLDGRGDTPEQLMRSLRGKGQVSVRNGEIAGPLVDAIVKTGSSNRSARPILPESIASFDAATLGFAIDKGRLSLDDSWIVWPNLRAMVTGSASVPQQRLDLRAAVTAASDDPATAGDQPAAFGLAGPWRDLHLWAEHNGS